MSRLPTLALPTLALRTLVLATLSIAVLAVTALATIVVHADVAKLTHLSDVVVDATVSSTQTVVEDDGATIWTTYEMRVSETLSGDNLETITVHVPGGTLGKLTQDVSGTARMKRGARAVLFLAKESGRNLVLGEAQGCFHVTRDAKTKELVCRNDVQGLALVGPDGAKVDAEAIHLTLRDLRAKVAAAAKEKEAEERRRREVEERRLKELRKAAERHSEETRGKPGGAK